MYWVALLAFVATVSANVVTDTKCPDVTPVSNFDFKKYGQGTWYEVARYPNTAETNAVCGSAEYALEGDVVKVKNIHVVDNKLKVIEGTHQLAPDAGNFGKVIVRLPYGAHGAVIDNVLNVVAFNDEYFIGYFCKYYEAKKRHFDFAWILSRSKVLSPAAKADIDKFIKDSTYLDTSRFVWPSFSDDDCKIIA